LYWQQTPESHTAINRRLFQDLEKSILTRTQTFRSEEEVPDYIITYYDSEKEDAFLVHKENEIIKLECSPEGLYQYEVSKGYKKDLKKNEIKTGTSNLISTVTKNRKGYTLRQLEHAKEARNLYHIVGTPTMENFQFFCFG
jgi:hypothetical protein